MLLSAAPGIKPLVRVVDICQTSASEKRLPQVFNKTVIIDSILEWI